MSKYLNMNRRDILKSLAAIGVSYSVLPLLTGTAHAAGEVHYHTWSGYDVPDLMKSYTDKYGGMPEVSHIASEEESFTKMKTGWSPDLIHPGNYNVRRFKDAGLLKPIDTSRLKNFNDIIESVRNDDSCFMDGAQYMIPTEYGNSSVIYRKDLVDEKYHDDPTWGILYDEKYSGRLAQYESAAAVIQCAALVLGYDNIYNLSDVQLVEIKKLASKQRDMLRMYWSDATQLEQAIATGEVVAAYGWNASLVNLKKQGLDVAMMVPKESMFTWIAGFTMHKNVKNEAAAYDLIDAWSAAESGAWLMENYGYGSTNKKAYEIADPKVLADLGIADPQAVLDGSLFFKSLDPAIETKYQSLFTDIQAGG
jgi:spermidine/putrescine transport system substrate-binding protein